MAKILIIVIYFLISTMTIIFIYYKKQDIDLYFKLKLADQLLVKLKKLIIFCQKNLHYTYKL